MNGTLLTTLVKFLLENPETIRLLLDCVTKMTPERKSAVLRLVEAAEKNGGVEELLAKLEK